MPTMVYYPLMAGMQDPSDQRGLINWKSRRSVSNLAISNLAVSNRSVFNTICSIVTCPTGMRLLRRDDQSARLFFLATIVPLQLYVRFVFYSFVFNYFINPFMKQFYIRFHIKINIWRRKYLHGDLSFLKILSKTYKNSYCATEAC